MCEFSVNLTEKVKVHDFDWIFAGMAIFCHRHLNWFNVLTETEYLPKHRSVTKIVNHFA